MFSQHLDIIQITCTITANSQSNCLQQTINLTLNDILINAEIRLIYAAAAFYLQNKIGSKVMKYVLHPSDFHHINLNV